MFADLRKGFACTVTYEGYTYCFTHEETHRNVRFISCDVHQLYVYESGVDLEVEGVRYIEIDASRAGRLRTGPAPSRGRDLELEGGVNACHVDYVYGYRDSHVRVTE